MKRSLLLGIFLFGCSAIQPLTPATNDAVWRILPPAVALDALGVSVPLQVSGGTATWRGDNDAVATIDAGGRLTTVGNGKVKVRAERDGHVAETTLDVQQLAVTLEVTPPKLSFAGPGDTKTLTVAALDRNDRPVTTGLSVQSGDEGVVQVSAAGAVNAVGSGQAEVLVSVGGRKATVRVEVGGTSYKESVPNGPAGQAHLNIRL